LDIYLFMLTTWLRPSRGHPTVSEFPNVERIARSVLPRDSIQLVYENWIADNS
jgi:glutathione S-transferase